MEGCITDVRKTLVEKLLNKAIEKSRYLFCFTCIVKEFNEEKDKLEVEIATMRQHFKVATEKGKDVQSNAEFWEKQVDKLIQENIDTKQRYYFGFCPDCIWRYKRGEDLATKTKVIKSLMEKGEKFENIEITRCLPGVERYSSQYYISFKSRELKSKELLDALKDDSNYMVGLHGMGGAGKTTLAKEVGKQLRTLEHFKYVIDTTVSFNLEIKKIQNDIAGSLGLEWGEINESDRPKKLWSRLTDGDKILVILDDVWENLNFDDIGLPSSDNHKGCIVLVTTRELRVCEQMGCGKTIQLELLTEEEALIMFKMYADLSNISSKSILGKVREITNLCKILPVAIAIIARSLKGKKSGEEWDVALNCLKKPVSMGNVEEDLVDVFKCLKFSYDHLKNEKAKRLFLLCSAFPEDEEISVELLTRLGIGVNLFGEGYEKYNDARSQAIVEKNKLLNSCLLLETKERYVKMHDLVREVAQWISNEEILAINFFEKNQKSLVERGKNIKYLLFQGKLMDLFSSSFDGSKLEILIAKLSMDDYEDVPTSLFESMVRLRVLNLSNTFYIRKTLYLPKSIQLLKNICFLSVEYVNLGDISVLGSLQSLETLELNRCEIDDFSPEIAKLKKLRLLSLRCEIRSNNPFEVIERCPSLEELYFIHSFNNFCQEITLPTLERYLLSDYSSHWNWSKSKAVALKGDRLSEATYKYVMKTSYYLHLIRIQGWINLMPEMVPIDEGMNDLIVLRLEEISQLQCLVDTKHINSQVPIVFSQLVVLKLEKMKALEELCNGPISFDSMNNLKELYIAKCEKLRSLFKCSLNLSSLKTVKLFFCSRSVSVFELSTSQSLPLLEELVIIGREKLENIITFERTVTDDTIENSCHSLFPKLKVLHIRRCPELQFILPILSARDFEFLEVIRISCCHKLKYIFGQHQDVKLTSLKEVAIDDLPNFIDICPPKASSISQDSSKPQTQLDTIKSNTFSMCCYRYKLKSTKIPSVSEDQPQDCSISLESNSHCLDIWERAQCLLRQSHILCNTKEIHICNFPKINSVFIQSNAPRMLETLTIGICEELKQIIIDTGDHNSTSGNNFGNVFPNLKWLGVESCVQLEYIFGHYNHDHLPPFDKRSMDGTIIKELSGNEENGQQMNLSLEHIKLFALPMMRCLFVGLKYSFVLNNLTQMEIVRCEKLEIVFSTSVLRCLPQLVTLEIAKCKELKHIIEDDLEDKNFQSSNTFFPKLERLIVTKCDKLKQIIIDTGDHNSTSGNNFGNVFPKLKRLCVENCVQLEYIFGHYNHDHHNQLASGDFIKELSGNEENGQQMNLSLEDIMLADLPMMRCLFVGLKYSFVLNNLTKITIRRYEKLEIVFSTSVLRCLPQLVRLDVEECKELKHIIEDDLEDKKFQSSNTFFPKLETLIVTECDKLKYVFPVSICKELPMLRIIFIREANELEEIFKSDKKDEIEEISKSEVQIPNLKVVGFANLPSLCHAQGVHFQAVKHRFVHSCQKLSLTSCNIEGEVHSWDFMKDYNYLHHRFEEIQRECDKAKGEHDEESENDEETDSDYDNGNDDEGIQINVEEGNTSDNAKTITSSTQLDVAGSSSGQFVTYECKTSSQQEGSTSEITAAATVSNITETKIKPPKQKGIEINVEEGTASAYAKTITSSTHLDVIGSSSGQLVTSECKTSSQGIEINVEERTASAYAKTITSSTHLDVAGSSSGKLVTSECKTSSQEDGDSQIDMTSFSISTTETSNQGSLNHDSFKKVSSNIEEQFPKDDDIIFSKSKPSPSITSPVVYQFPPVPCKEDPSQKVQDLSSLLVKSELEQLVSKNHLDYGNLSLLTDFFVKHPSVRLKDTSLSNRYKGCAYNLLAELLKFLKTHSILEGLGSCHSEFVELLQDAHSFGFDKDWLDGVERRALFPDIQVSQDALQKLLDSKQ